MSKSTTRHLWIISFLCISFISILISIYFGIFKVVAKEKPKVDLIILITSALYYEEKRTAIRRTWVDNRSLSALNKTVKYFFVIGRIPNKNSIDKNLRNEMTEYNDIVLLDVEDDLDHLTEKVLESFWWTNRNFNFKFLLKCDDDSYVRLDKLTEALAHIEEGFLKKDTINFTEDIDIIDYTSYNIQKNPYVTERLNLYWGYFVGNVIPLTYGPYAEFNWIACDKYVPYAFGGGYILSEGVVKYLSKNKDYFRHYKAEDVSIGIWMSTMTNVIRIHDVRFDSEYESFGCKNYYMVMHSVSPESMFNLHESLLSTGHPCVVERKRLRVDEYRYDWSVVPSNCCPEITNFLFL